MAEFITGFNIGTEKDKKIDYNKAIANKPDLTGFAEKTEVEALKDEIARIKITSGGAVKLDKDIKNPERLWINGNTTIDLAGHTIETNEKYLFIVNPNATLTINDSVGTGKFKSVFSENEAAIKVSGGSLIVNGATIEAGDGKQGGVIFVNDGGNVTINGGNLSSASAVISGNNLQGDINITINGGTLTTKYGAAIYDPAQGHVTVNGGTLNGGISARMGQITINDGVFNAATESLDDPATYYKQSVNAWYPDAVYVSAGTYTSKNETLGNSVDLKIKGGTFNVTNGKGSPVAVYDIGKVEQKAKVTVTGGTFTTNAKNRGKVDVLSLADIGVTSPAAGYGVYSGKVVTSITV